MEQILSDSQSHRRFTMFLLTVFSVIALGLAVTGIYGVTLTLLLNGTSSLVFVWHWVRGQRI